MVTRPAVAADDALLTGILASDRHGPVVPGLLPNRRHHPARWLVAGVAVVGVVVAVVVSVTSPPVVQPAFADWTTQPAADLTAAQKQQVYDGCSSLIQDRIVVNQFGQTVSSRGATAIIVDERGSYHVLLVGSDSMWGLCSNLTTDGSLYGQINQNYADPGWTVSADDIAFVWGMAGPVFGKNDPAMFEVTLGRAGSNVVGVQVVTNRGLTMDASLADGFWVVYGPVDWDAMVADRTDGFSQYIVTLTDGTVTTIDTGISGDYGIGGLMCFGQTTPPAGLMCQPEPSDQQTAIVTPDSPEPGQMPS